jgi:hypothetical protein
VVYQVFAFQIQSCEVVIKGEDKPLVLRAPPQAAAARVPPAGADCLPAAFVTYPAPAAPPSVPPLTRPGQPRDPCDQRRPHDRDRQPRRRLGARHHLLGQVLAQAVGVGESEVVAVEIGAAVGQHWGKREELLRTRVCACECARRECVCVCTCVSASAF